MENKKRFGILEIILIILVTAVASGLTTGIILKSNEVQYADLSANPAIQEFLEVYASLVTGYYEELDENELVNSAIEGMFNYLGDDYSSYLDQNSADSLESQLSGEYEGIGVQIYNNNTVFKVFENSPASKAGIKVEDQIVKVNGVDVLEKTSSEIASMIKTTTNGKVDLELLRNNEVITMTLELAKLNVPSVETEIKEANNKKIGYMYISTFSSTTAKQVESELLKLEDSGIDSLIIDLRNNTGGYLSAAKDISSLFLEKGKIIYALEEKNKVSTVKDKTGTKRDYDIAILINSGTASASEILAAALKESYGATLVGETSYGKGKVQQKLTLGTGGSVKYTSAKWLTPTGNCIDGKGLVPDYEIVADHSLLPTSSDPDTYLKEYEIYYNHIIEVENKQLNKAVEVLSK